MLKLDAGSRQSHLVSHVHPKRDLSFPLEHLTDNMHIYSIPYDKDPTATVLRR